MTHNPGPNYREWLEIIKQSKSNFEELHAIANRLEEGEERLTQAQRADLLQRLGDLQIAAARREERMQA